MDEIKEDEVSTPHGVLSTSNNKLLPTEVLKETTDNYLRMIANQAKRVEKQTKKKYKSREYLPSTINIDISPQSFVSEKFGRFSDYYRIISRIGQGGCGSVRSSKCRTKTLDSSVR